MAGVAVGRRDVIPSAPLTAIEPPPLWLDACRRHGAGRLLLGKWGCVLVDTNAVAPLRGNSPDD